MTLLGRLHGGRPIASLLPFKAEKSRESLLEDHNQNSSRHHATRRVSLVLCLGDCRLGRAVGSWRWRVHQHQASGEFISFSARLINSNTPTTATTTHKPHQSATSQQHEDNDHEQRHLCCPPPRPNFQLPLEKGPRLGLGVILARHLDDLTTRLDTTSLERQSQPPPPTPLARNRAGVQLAGGQKPTTTGRLIRLAKSANSRV